MLLEQPDYKNREKYIQRKEKMMNKLIELKNLTKNFDDQQVLRGINLDIYEKEFLTLLGPSGCGKTTAPSNHCRL